MSAGVVRVAIEKDGQLPQLIILDQTQPLETIIKEICVRWNISIPEQYAFQYADYNLYITEENRFEISNGNVLKLTLSPAKLSQDLYDKLNSQNVEDKKSILKQLAHIAEDPTFAGEFIKRNGLGLIISMLEARPESPETMANALKAFQELMEHPGIKWDILTHGFIKNLTVFVNKQTGTDPTVLKRCLAILESTVSNSSNLFPICEKETKFESLKLHIHNSNQEIQLNALALINALFMKTDPKKKKAFADMMLKSGVRNEILGQIIRSNKPIKNEMAHQLFVHQALMFSLNSERLRQSGDQRNQSLLESLDILRKTAFETDNGSGRPLSQMGNIGMEFKRLGFTNFNNPVEDFMETPPGLLPVHCMVYFASRHHDQYIKVVCQNIVRGDDNECPFARSSVALTKLLCELLRVTADAPTESSEEFYPIFFTTDYGFEEFYCICIQIMNKTWKEMRANSADFSKVMAIVKLQIVRSLAEKHHTMEAFRNFIFNLGFTQIVKYKNEEDRSRNIQELKTKPVLELKQQILPELKKLVSRQRLDQLIEGKWFEKHKKRDNNWYCKLSPNLKFLHYGDCQVGQVSPTLEALPNKLPISSIKQLVVGKDCPHSKDKKTLKMFFFSLIYERDTSDEYLNFTVPNQQIFDVWVDGLSVLLNKEMTSTISKEDLETLLNMEIKLRLLDLENIPIPESPPPIPADPPNYNFVYNF